MGGRADAKLVRKRKRKTRSERNLLRNSQMEQDKKEDKSSRRKDDDIPHNPYYSLRSSKVIPAAALPPAPRESRMSKNLTQGRLTMGLFAYSKSSDTVKRGSLPGTSTVKAKKKVEDSMRHIVIPTVKTMTSHSEDGGAGCDSCNRKQENSVVIVSDTDRNNPVELDEQNNMRQVPPSSTTASYTHRAKNVQAQAMSPASSVSHKLDVNATAKTCLKPNSTTSPATVKMDNDLDEVLPVNEIAKKILLNLKPKFNKIFPTRDLNKELNAGLKKLLKQSSRKVSVADHIPGSSMRERLHLGNQQTAATFTSKFTVYHPFGTEPTVSPKFQSVCIPDVGDESETAIAAQNLLSDNSFFINDGSSLTSLSSLPPLQHFITSNSCLQSHQLDLSRPVRFLIPSNYPDGNDDKDDTIQNYNNVNLMAESDNSSNHTLQHHLQSYDQYASYSLTKPYHRRDSHLQDSIRVVGDNDTKSPQGFVLPNAFGDSCDGHEPDKPIIINIHGKDGVDSGNGEESRFALAKYNSFVASARSLKAKLERQNEQKHIMSSRKHGAMDLSAFGIRKSHMSSGSHTVSGSNQNNSNNHHHNHHYHLRSRSHLPTIPDCFVSKEDANGTVQGSSNLIQSRHRLKTALDSILMDPPAKPVKSSLLYCNEGSMEWQDVDDVRPHGSNVFYHTQEEYDIHRQPLDCLHMHQSDMQHQARSFLNNHLDPGLIGMGQCQMDASQACLPSPPSPLPTDQRRLRSLSSSSCPTQAWL